MAVPARKPRPAAARPTEDILGAAIRTIGLEREGLAALEAALANGMGEPFHRAVALMKAARGRVIVSGIGKSGHVGQKVAATLASTGTPAFFVHPTEAAHGDLGMITREDVVVALSWSGETVELKGIIAYAGRFAVPLIAITSNAQSTLAKSAEVVLVLPRAKEACPHGLAPTTSTTMQIALGDALAVALIESKGFTAHDFKAFHPGGSLGASLKHVGDLMHTDEAVPLAREDMRMSEAIVVMSSKSFGCVGVVDGEGRLVGMITDGDLRRHMSPGLLERTTAEIMTRKPLTLAPETLAAKALEVLNSKRRTNIFVVEDGRPVGILHVHDLLRVGVA
jgi:arabinose-5-phosphate isomerase